MQNLLKQIVDICYSKETGIKKRMVFSILLIIIGLIAMLIFLIRLFIYEGHGNIHHSINLPDAGQIGDFVGGVSGTLFTLVGVVLLFETLALQRNEFVESRKVFEKQQFDNTFFNLIQLYQEVVKSLHYNSSDSYDEKTYTGKEFFERNHVDFYNSYLASGGVFKNRKAATVLYLGFYTSTKEQTAHYFRTIYRIFKFVKTNSIDEDEKEKYAKIIRAQLSESELLFLYYNAFTEYGKKFRALINEYHILKHLPAIEKLEFKKYALQLNHIEKNSVQIVFDDVKNFIGISLNEQKDCHKTLLSGIITIMTKSTGNTNFTLTIIKKTNAIARSSHQQGYGLQNFNLDDLEHLFYNFIIDILYFSNYYEYNRHLTVNHSRIANHANTKHTIEISAINTNQKPIKFN
jgi:hypothetical protein